MTGLMKEESAWEVTGVRWRTVFGRKMGVEWEVERPSKSGLAREVGGGMTAWDWVTRKEGGVARRGVEKVSSTRRRDRQKGERLVFFRVVFFYFLSLY